MPRQKQKIPHCLRLAVLFRKWTTNHPKGSIWRVYRSKWALTEVASVIIDRKCKTLKDAVAVFGAITEETVARLRGPQCREEPAAAKVSAAA